MSAPHKRHLPEECAVCSEEEQAEFVLLCHWKVLEPGKRGQVCPPT